MQKYQKQCVSSGLDAVLAAFYLKNAQQGSIHIVHRYHMAFKA